MIALFFMFAVLISDSVIEPIPFETILSEIFSLLSFLSSCSSASRDPEVSALTITIIRCLSSFSPFGIEFLLSLLT